MTNLSFLAAIIHQIIVIEVLSELHYNHKNTGLVYVFKFLFIS